MQADFDAIEQKVPGLHAQHPRASKAEQALVARCLELRDLYHSDSADPAAPEHLRRWIARTAHTIQEHFGHTERDHFSRSLRNWESRIRLSPSVQSHCQQCLNFVYPLIEELRSHPNELFARLAPASPPRLEPEAQRESVFIVHGHNHRLKDEVAQFIERVHGKRPIILLEQPDMGRTIIEKLEEYARQAAFAVVLLTSDDPQSKKQALQRKKFGAKNRRARQNVILELGYFWAILGRDKVAILYEEGIEMPSDSQGVLYKSVSSQDGWKSALAKEMHHAGLVIDPSLAL